MSPSRATTAPTVGLGYARPAAAAASSRARAIVTHVTLTTGNGFTLRPMTPRFRADEVVRILNAPWELAVPGDEAVVEEVAGPNEDGTGWLLTLRLCSAGAGDSMIVLG